MSINRQNKTAAFSKITDTLPTSHPPSHGVLYVKAELIKPPPSLWRVINPHSGAGAVVTAAKQENLETSPSVINLRRFSAAGRSTARAR